MKIIKLYDVPKWSKVRLPIGNPSDSDGKIEECVFHHIDGMYSYITTPSGHAVHLGASTPMVLCADGVYEVALEEVLPAPPKPTKEPFKGEAWRKGYQTAYKDADDKAKERLKKYIGMLRQWLNEDRIDDSKKMVTNEQIEDWLLKDDV